MKTFLRALHIAWRGACLAGVIFLIGGRSLRYAPLSWAPELDHLLGLVMIEVVQWFLWPWVLMSIFYIPILGVGIVGVVVFRRRLVRWENGAWHFTPSMVSLVFGAAVALHYLFDINPLVAATCAGSLAVGLPGLRRRPGPLELDRSAWLVLAGWSVFFVAAMFFCRDAADRITVALWAVLLMVAWRWASRWLGTAEIRLVLTMAIIPANLLPAILPLALPLHGGTRLADGLAYDFCEPPGQNRLLVTMPTCTSLPRLTDGYNACKAGRIAAYDLDSLRLADTYRFFSDGYFGRLEQLVCLADEVHVGIQATTYNGENYGQTALSFPLSSPQAFKPNVAGRGLGTSIAYDAKRDALFYTGEYTHRILRVARGTGERSEDLGAPFIRGWQHPLNGTWYTGSLAMRNESIDPRRDRLMLVEWMRGRHVFALDLETLKPAGRHAVNSGGSLGANVDASRDRLYVASLWGLEVVDLPTGRVVARRRLGLANRPPVIDEERGVLYVSSSVEGKIRVLDGDTLEVVDQIPVGFGTRHPYLTRDGRRLFASSSRGTYHWELPR